MYTFCDKNFEKLSSKKNKKKIGFLEKITQREDNIPKLEKIKIGPAIEITAILVIFSS